jgi:hypothetical protein
MHLQLQDETGRDISMAIAASRFPTTVPTFLGFREIEQFSFAANLRGYGEIIGHCSNRMRPMALPASGTAAVALRDLARRPLVAEC